MTSTETTLHQYLAEAHAGEVALVNVLTEQIALAPRGTLRQALERHLGETRDHAERIERRLGELGQSRSRLGAAGAAAVSAVEAVALQGLALAKTPLDLVRGGTDGYEKVLKNARDACATEALEIAQYDAIEQVAKSAGDEETATLIASIRADEERMLQTLRAEIPGLAAKVVGDSTFKPSETGAADAARKTARKAKAKASSTARKSSAKAKATASSAESKAKATAEKAGKEAGVKEPIKGYDDLTVDEVVKKVGDDQDLAREVKRYERSHKDRQGVKDGVPA